MVEQGGEYIIGRNSVREAIRSDQQIDKVFVQQGLADGSIRELLMLARQRKLVIASVPRAKLDELCAGLGIDGRVGNHQGIIVQVPAFKYSEMDDIFALAEMRGEKPFIMILDSIQDPHNLGAIIRSAEAIGAHGIILGKRRAASLTTAAYKVSCGAAQYIPIVKVTNINHAIEELKEKNVWVAAADMDGQPLAASDLRGAYALVIGGESEGIGKLTKELCDIVVKIEMNGKTSSLNAACAASILMYEKRRQDLMGKE
ncbi:MAG: 23S rRNA (guanosine(2251)-2'-O)-methyltransferase RlmB [Christensenella sp.]|nr:23S rRNA (guanosine(2251)-2'-O)-methyltransferase RlmB [Christensenella sp.]